MKIGSRNSDDEVILIAEIGNNHEGNFELAQKLVHLAAECGADAVKFQTFRTEHYVSAGDTARFNRLKSFELTFDQFATLGSLAKSLGLIFISTPFDLQSAEFLSQHVDAFKIASPDNTFFPLLKAVAAYGKPTIISGGASCWSNIEDAVRFLRDNSPAGAAAELAALHCVTAYPAPPEQLNLRVIETMRQKLGVTVGFSDHTTGIDAAVCAVALGARIIEKHFTIDHNYSAFQDHKVSADPAGLRLLAEKLKLAEQMLGDGQKQVAPCEEKVIALTHRSIVAGGDFPAGRQLGLADLTWIRPAGGLPPGREELLIGKRLKHAVSFGQMLRQEDVE